MPRVDRMIVRTAVVVHATARAWLLELEGEEVWLPKEVAPVEPQDAEKGDTVEVSIPERLAREKGLI